MPFSFRPKQDKTIPFLIFISFLLTFVGSRIITYTFPDLFLTVKGVHIHHFAYGIILLSIFGLISLGTTLSYQNRLRLSVLYGFALGLAFDEFAMWLELDDLYRDRRNFDAALIISLIFLNIIYFDSFWKRWSRRLHKLATIIFFGGSKSMLRLVKALFT